jgi:Tol biopolymer transport system component
MTVSKMERKNRMKANICLKFAAIILALCIFSCTDTEQVNTGSTVGPTSTSLDKPPSTPGNANPKIVYKRNYQVNPNRSVPAIYVMDENGENKTKVYSNYTNQTYQSPDYPAWSPDGTKLCFTLNGADLYTLSISIINGYPSGSNPIKIGDGVTGGGSYRKGAWRPGANQIACVWQHTADPYKIHILPSSGGSPSTIYTSVNNDWVIEDYLSFKSDGSRLAFIERQISTGYNFLKVLDVSNGSIIKSIDLSQFKLITGMDWRKSSGSNIVAISIWPLCSIDYSGQRKLYSLDVDSPAPSPTLLSNSEKDGVSWSSDDSKIVTMWGTISSVCGNGCCVRHLSGIASFSLNSQTTTSIEQSSAVNPDWRR